MMAELLVLRLVHVLGGVFWVVAMMYNAFFLMPTIAQAGPAAAGPIIAGFQQPKLFVWLPIVAILTMAIGVAAATVLFSVAWGVLVKPLPWPDADRLILG